jgi:hypothetical protein
MSAQEMSDSQGWDEGGQDSHSTDGVTDGASQVQRKGPVPWGSGI